MKKLHLILTVVCFILLAGCGSDDNTPSDSLTNEAKIVGTWKPYLTIENSKEYPVGSTYEIIEFKTGGTFIYTNERGDNKPLGTYTLDDDILRIKKRGSDFIYRILQLDKNELKLEDRRSRKIIYYKKINN